VNNTGTESGPKLIAFFFISIGVDCVQINMAL